MQSHTSCQFWLIECISLWLQLGLRPFTKCAAKLHTFVLLFAPYCKCLWKVREFWMDFLYEPCYTSALSSTIWWTMYIILCTFTNSHCTAMSIRYITCIQSWLWISLCLNVFVSRCASRTPSRQTQGEAQACSCCRQNRPPQNPGGPCKPASETSTSCQQQSARQDRKQPAAEQ